MCSSDLMLPSQLLASVLVAGAAALPSGCARTKVAILGGGTAGITAAQALANASLHDFIILEYQDRIGGRAQHTQFGAGPDGEPYTVELGANWVQGLGRPGGPENPIWTLAKKHKLKTTTNDYKSIATYTQKGASNFTTLVTDVAAAMRRMSVEAGRMLAENEQDRSARAGLALAGWAPAHHDMEAQAAEYWSWDFDASLPPDQSSMIFGSATDNLTFGQFSPENNIVIDPRGYDALARAEAASFLSPNDPRLQLNKHVTDIHYSDSTVTVSSSDGSCVQADYAICTFSLGVLQSDAVHFHPPLPAWKQAAIRSFDMGTYTKLFLQFNHTFWPKHRQFMLYASPTQRGRYPIWQSLDGHAFIPGSHIIFATVNHDESYRIEQQTDAETKAELLAVLADMFPDVEIPQPTAFLYPRWTKTPWARGSYSNWPVGTTLETHQNLRANTGRLWFAGEATSAQYFGYMHGAWFEGREAGAHVAELASGRSCFRIEGEAEVCGERLRYETLKGTSPLEHYTLLNGWAAKSFAASKTGEGE